MNLMEQNNADTPAVIKNTEGSNFIPQIKITYSLSKAFKEQKAKLGELTHGDTTLGESVNAVLTSYRLHCYSTDNNGSRQNTLILTDNGSVIEDRDEYIKFVEKEKKLGRKTIKGVDLLLYLPDLNLFGVLFCKDTGYLKSIPAEFFKYAGGKIVNLTVNPIFNKNRNDTYYGLTLRDTGEKLEKQPADIESQTKLFDSKTTDELPKDIEEDADGRER